MRRYIVTLAAAVTLALVTSLSAQQMGDEPQPPSTSTTTNSQQTGDDMAQPQSQQTRDDQAQPQSMSSDTMDMNNSTSSDMQVVPGTPIEDGKPVDYSKNPFWDPNPDWSYIEATAGGN